MKREASSAQSAHRKRVNLGQSSGFSLVELLVSTAILTTLMVLLFGFFEQATRAWQNSEKKVDAFREARAALYFLKRDLEALYVDNEVPYFVCADPSNTVPVAYSGASRPPSEHGNALFFISKQPFDSQEASKAKSDLCAIGYYLVFDRDPAAIGTTRSSYRLLRYFKSSDETWNNSSTPGFGLWPFFKSITTPGGAPDFSKLFPTAEGRTTGDEVIARNVINFKVRALDREYQELQPTDTNRYNVKPAFFDLSLTALNLETSQKLKTQKDWHKTGPSYGGSDLFQKNAQEFSLRVALPP
ncbi:MAG: prepilin-type N-terminal cleavage/methylation domain-containing protein [Blastochloris sp.]|nr:prepilin-type N-terminal cleavage/methylation domain-containing protein [Blastochloris sp.]